MKIEKIYSRNRIKFHNVLNNKNNKKIDKKFSFLFNIIIIMLTAIITFKSLLGAINPILNRLCMDEAKNIATKISNEETRSKINIKIPEDFKERSKLIEKLEKEMKEHAKNLDFEKAMEIRDFVKEIRKTIF